MALHHTPAEKRESRIEKLKSEIADLEYDRDAQVRTTGYWKGHGSTMMHSRKKKLAVLEAEQARIAALTNPRYKLDLETEYFEGMAGETCEAVVYMKNGYKIKREEWIVLASAREIRQLFDLVEEQTRSNEQVAI